MRLSGSAAAKALADAAARTKAHKAAPALSTRMRTAATSLKSGDFDSFKVVRGLKRGVRAAQQRLETTATRVGSAMVKHVGRRLRRGADKVSVPGAFDVGLAVVPGPRPPPTAPPSVDLQMDVMASAGSDSIAPPSPWTIMGGAQAVPGRPTSVSRMQTGRVPKWQSRSTAHLPTGTRVNHTDVPAQGSQLAVSRQLHKPKPPLGQAPPQTNGADAKSTPDRKRGVAPRLGMSTVLGAAATPRKRLAGRGKGLLSKLRTATKRLHNVMVIGSEKAETDAPLALWYEWHRRDAPESRMLGTGTSVCACIHPCPDGDTEQKQLCARGKLQWDLFSTRNRAWFVFTTVMMLVYMPVTTKILSFFLCEEVADSYWLIADRSQKCFTRVWWTVFPLALSGVFWFILLIPCALLFLVCRARYRHVDDYLNVLLDTEPPPPRVAAGQRFETWRGRFKRCAARVHDCLGTKYSESQVTMSLAMREWQWYRARTLLGVPAGESGEAHRSVVTATYKRLCDEEFSTAVQLAREEERVKGYVPTEDERDLVAAYLYVAAKRPSQFTAHRLCLQKAGEPATVSHNRNARPHVRLLWRLECNARSAV